MLLVVPSLVQQGALCSRATETLDVQIMLKSPVI